MINTDLEMYNGVYQRINNNLLITDLLNILKRNNFKIPIVQNDHFTLEYSKFCDLLEDLRVMRLTNVLYNRNKKFEKKNYFKKLEENYKKNYFENNKFILDIHILIVSGWKN